MLAKRISLIIFCYLTIADVSFGFGGIKVGGTLGKLGEDIKREANSCLSGGCNPGKVIKKGMEDAVSDIVGEASDAVAESIIKAADHVFNKQIDPLLERMNVVVAEQIKRTRGEVENGAKNIINHTVDKIISGFTPWLKEAARVAEMYSPEEIEDHLINTSFDRLEELEAKVFQGADALLSKIEVMIDGTIEKIDCTVDGMKDDLIFTIRDRYTANLFPNPLDSCRRETGTQFKPGPSLTNSDLYNLNKCWFERDIRNAIENNKSIDIIIGRYTDLVNLASEIQCIERRGFTKRYVKDWLKYSTKAEMWTKLY